jgi:hypothetical protein
VSGFPPVRMFRFICQFGPQLTQRLIGLVVLCGVCLAMIPLPLAPDIAIVADKDRSKPFPCQDRACGCRNAEQCWKKCCCFTNVEKVTWAKAHDFKLPDFVLTAAGEEIARSARPGAGSKCANCLASASSHCGPAGEAASGATSRDTSTVASTPAKRSTRWVIGIAAERCRGEHGTISSLPVSITGRRCALARFVSLSIEADAIPVSEVTRGLTRRPAVPPPRQATCA